jgi:hypothetical protein
VLQHWLWVLHPWALFFVFLVVVTFGAAATTLTLGLWRILRGPKRSAALAWLLVALLPLLVWASMAYYAYRNGQKHGQPHDLPMILMTRVGHNLMETEAIYLWPSRLESARLVMFYDARITDPEGDLRAMDQHVARLEQMTGLPLRTKIYWVRGGLLGQRALCCYGIVLGSDQSPAGSLDRHELAHAVETQHASPEKDSPTLLGEGWAESQSLESRELAEGALDLAKTLAEWARLPETESDEMLASTMEPEGFRRLMSMYKDSGKGPSYLRELTGPFWYHRHNGPVYIVGGAFVDFLVRRYGAKRFFELYYACRPGTFEADCCKTYGAELDALEEDFWADARLIAKK